MTAAREATARIFLLRRTCVGLLPRPPLRNPAFSTRRSSLSIFDTGHGVILNLWHMVYFGGTWLKGGRLGWSWGNGEMFWLSYSFIYAGRCRRKEGELASSFSSFLLPKGIFFFIYTRFLNPSRFR
jgi:hypothetical protein